LLPDAGIWYAIGGVEMFGRATKAAIPYILPCFFIYALFILYPTYKVFSLSLFRWRGLTAGAQKFVGLTHFQRLLHDWVFWKSLSNSLLIFLVGVVLSIVVALFFATILSERIKGSSFYRATWLFPNLLGDVIIATIWTFIYHPTLGLLNGILKSIGLGMLCQTWLGDRNIAVFSVALPMIWKYTGFYIILFLAAIQEIPRSFLDAADIDGCSKMQRFLYITLPLLKQTIGVALVFVMATSMDAIFAYVKLLTEGGPGRATEVVSTYIYQQAFSFSYFGYASAVSVAGFIMMGTLTAIIVRLLMRQRM
jgi:ABC-type sugar transport system permease subunit